VSLKLIFQTEVIEDCTYTTAPDIPHNPWCCMHCTAGSNIMQKNWELWTDRNNKLLYHTT